MGSDAAGAREVVEAFWAAMNSNDFAAASLWLHEDYTLDWPQSGERITGRTDFAALNAAYPAAGPWRFTVNRLVADGPDVVTDVTVTDGAVVARAVTFSRVQDGRILHQTEYWPDPYPAPAWRAAWVSPMPPGSPD
jgi:limonene-1,2-epoxide hydrolase